MESNPGLLEKLAVITGGKIYADDADVLVVEGIPADPGRAFIPRLSGDIARSLQADVVLVASADSHPVAVGAARRDITALGFEVGRVVSLPTTRADVA